MITHTLSLYHLHSLTFSQQIQEETQMRVELQGQLQQSESKLRQLQQGIGAGSYVSNGPSTETDGATANIPLCKSNII